MEWGGVIWVAWEGSGSILVQETVPEFDLRVNLLHTRDSNSLLPGTSHCAVLQHYKHYKHYKHYTQFPPTSFCVASHFFTACFFVWKWLSGVKVWMCSVYRWTVCSQWLLCAPPGSALSNSTFCPHSVFMCFVWISEQTAIISLYNINWLVCITEI